MDLQGFQWIISVLLIPLIWKIWDTLKTDNIQLEAKMRSITSDIWNDLHKHEENDNKFHLDIVQNVIPNSMRDLAARMDARFDRLEDKIEKRKDR